MLCAALAAAVVLSLSAWAYADREADARRAQIDRAAKDPPDVEGEIRKLRSADTGERASAIMALRYMGMRGEAGAAVPVLIQMLGDETKFPGMMLMSSSLSAITRSCSSEYTFGGEAAETLARIGDTSDELLALLDSDTWRVRADAARALGGVKDRRAVDRLIATLADGKEHAVVKGNAALALELMKVRQAVKPLLATLKDNDPRVRAASASALGALGGQQVVAPLIEALTDDEPKVRISVAIAFGRIGGPAVVEPLLRALRDEHEQVREVAARAVGGTKDRRVVEPLIAALADEYANVRINAAWTLGAMKDAAALEPLIGLLADENDAVMQAAVAGLGELGDRRAIEPITVALQAEGDSVLMRQRGVAALAQLGHAGAAREMREHHGQRLHSDEWWSRHHRELLSER